MLNKKKNEYKIRVPFKQNVSLIFLNYLYISMAIIERVKSQSTN